MTDQKSCAERLPEHLNSRLETFRILTTAAGGDAESLDPRELAGEELPAFNEDNSDEIQEAADTRIWELPLAVSKRFSYRIELSYGGPQDYFIAEVERDEGEDWGGEIVAIRYHFLDWFDGASRDLSGSEFETAAEYVRRIVPELS